MRTVYRYDPETGKCHEIGREGKSYFHTVITDEMPATRHMADGQIYTSKRKFREATRRAGCVEVGNEKFPERQIKSNRKEITNYLKDAYERVRGK